MAGKKFTQDQVQSEPLKTPICRLAFPQLTEPKSFMNGAPEFSATLIFDSKDQLKEVVKEMKKVASNAFGATLPGKFWNPLRKCEEKPEYKGFEPGMYYMRVRAKADQKIKMVNAAAIDNLASDFYAGCYVRCDVHFWPYDQGANVGLTARLNGIQFVRDGERFAGRNVDFEALGVEEGAFDPDDESEDDFI